jgi:WD40 repeat protein
MRSWKPHGGKVQALAFSPDGRTLATLSGLSSFVTFWDSLTCAETKQFGGWGERLVAFEFTPDGEHLAALDHNGVVRIWATASDGNVPVADLAPAASGPAVTLAFSPTTGRLVTAHAEALNWWDEPTLTPKIRRKPTGIRTLGTYVSEIHALAFTPDGARLLVGRRDLDIWDETMSGAVAIVRTNKGGGLRAIAVSPDGTRAAARLKNTVRVCKLATVTWETTLHWGSDPVYAVAFSRDSRTLLTAGADGTVRFWDVGTWRETNRFDWGIGKIHLVAFAPDGLTCAAAGEKGKVVVWDVDA